MSGKYELMRIRGVHNHYGQRDTGSGAGGYQAQGPEKLIEVEITPDNLTGTFLPEVTVYQNSDIKSATLYVDEVFVLTGATVEVRAKGTPANKVDITELNLESLGKVDLTSALAGEWAATAYPTTADDLIELALTAGTVDDLDVGKARLVLELYHAV